MKKYEKPCLTAISLSGNDQLCGSCADNGGYLLKGDHSLALEMMDTYKFGNKSDGADAGDFKGVFGYEAQCDKLQIDGYCKFGVSGSFIVAWS